MTTVNVGTGAGGVGTATITPIVNFSGNIGPGQPTIPVLSNGFSPCEQFLVNLSSGNNTITVNSLSGWVAVVLPIGNTATITLKGVNGDTGLAFTGWTAFGMPNPNPGSFVLNASAGVNSVQIFQG